MLLMTEEIPAVFVLHKSTAELADPSFRVRNSDSGPQTALGMGANTAVIGSHLEQCAQ